MVHPEEERAPVLLEHLLDALQLPRRLHIEEEDGDAHDQQQPGQEEEHAVLHRAQLAAQHRQASDLTPSRFQNSKSQKLKIFTFKIEASAPTSSAFFSDPFQTLRDTQD